MSNEVNTILLETAKDMAEEMTGTWLERRIYELIDDNDLEELHRVVVKFGPDVAKKVISEELGDEY